MSMLMLLISNWAVDGCGRVSHLIVILVVCDPMGRGGGMDTLMIFMEDFNDGHVHVVYRYVPTHICMYVMYVCTNTIPSQYAP